ncbi:hypothetical protein AB0J68_01360 [Micromonospora sp. NPDC049580]|uniref:hypothetical protein n=1 Tax=Micromonospora sp. NPDC049580 TaxID=3154832 RepID=UPI00341F11BE
MTHPTPANPFPVPFPTGPRVTVFPAAAPATPAADVELQPFTLADDPCFPRGVDPALLGPGEHVEVTPENCGLGEDPIARVLWLSGLLGQAVAALTDAERAELDREYIWPARAARTTGQTRGWAA